MDAHMDRRTFLRRGTAGAAGLVAAGVGLPALLAACGSSSTSSSSTKASGTAAASLGSLDFQLSWIKDAEFAGEYIADTMGYYTKQGFSSVNLMSGGPNVAQDSVVAAGKALVGISSPDITGPAIAQGAPIITIGAQYQKNPFCIMSLAKNPLHTPHDMIGRKIGVQSTNQAVFTTFLKANDIDPSKVTLVPAQFDPSPLAAGQVDGWFSFITNEPIALGQKGVQTTTFLLNDFNYPLVSETFVVRTESLTKSRAQLKALLAAEIMGWHTSLANPVTGAQLAVDKYGADQKLDLTTEKLTSIAQNKLIVNARTATDGIFTVTPAQIAANIHTLGLGGTKLTGAQLFDMSVLDEVYQEHPELKTTPA